MKTKYMVLLLAVGLFIGTPGVPDATSLWANRSHVVNNFYADNRARNVGDIVTIVVSEDVKSERTSDIKTAKKESVLRRLVSIFYPPSVSSLGTQGGVLPEIQSNSSNSFDGGGEVDVEDKFNATITAMVIEVFPNGNLLVEGNKAIRVINENQNMTISGIVRPEDITQDNRVYSYLMADINIFYEGQGAIRDNQERSWFAKFWDKINII